MNNCLLTKLPGSISDSSLLKIGELRIHIVIEAGKENSFVVKSQKTITFKIINIVQGNPLFQDDTREKIGENNRCYFKNTTERQEFDLSISDKYSLTYIDLPVGTVDFDTKQLQYCNNLVTLYLNGNVSGHSEALRGLTNLKELYIRCAGFRLDMNDLKELPLQKLHVQPCFAEADMRFSIDPMQHMTHKTLTELRIEGVNKTPLKGAVGNLSSLAGFTDLKTLAISYTSICGDLCHLSGMTSLEGIWASECNFTGDLTDLPASCRTFANNAGSKSTVFTWTMNARSDKNSCVLSIKYPIRLSGECIYDMIKDQSMCKIPEVLNKETNLYEDASSEININTNDNHQAFLDDCSESLLSDLIGNKVSTLTIDGVEFIRNGIVVYSFDED